MLSKIAPAEDLRGLARIKSANYETKSVHPKLVDEEVAKGWTVAQKNKTSVRLRRAKAPSTLLEDRVWTLLFRMGFPYLSQAGGAILTLDPKEKNSPTTQIDVVGIDAEIALAVECKSQEQFKKKDQFQEEMAKHALIKLNFGKAVNGQRQDKLQIALAMFFSNVNLTTNDRERAKDANIVLFDDKDLDYYETLVNHLGPAAKYQFLADMLPGKPISGLSIRVPAVKTKMGGYDCYTFSISPEYLLKVSYVSHRSKGKPSDVDTYQRMLNKSRLKAIRQYITNDGIFPTNIVVNLDKKGLAFDRGHQEIDLKAEKAGTAGWLNINKPAYKSAWIIDGQHRLFAFSGHEKASHSTVSVLAFAGLPPSKQAELFIDINAKQKSVKSSLLLELSAELRWDADDPAVRVQAIISKAVQSLNLLGDSPFYNRIQTADLGKDTIRCISLTSICKALEGGDLYIAKEKNGHVVAYGPLWAGDSKSTLERTIYVLREWFSQIRTGSVTWWDKGAGEGGGLAMNDAVTACIDVMRSVFQHLDSTGQKLVHLENKELFECTQKFAEELGSYFGSLSETERKRFRDLRGRQGQIARMRRCQQALNHKFPNFNPDGLEKYLSEEKAQTNKQAKEIVDRIEVTLQNFVLETLKQQFGEDEAQWWMLGVPKNVRLRVSERFEEEAGVRGGKEHYFDLIHYRTIATENWDLFESWLAYGKSGSKDKRTSWISDLNEKRKVVSHASSGITLSIEELSQLQEYDKWLMEKLNGAVIDNSVEESG